MRTPAELIDRAIGYCPQIDGLTRYRCEDIAKRIGDGTADLALCMDLEKIFMSEIGADAGPRDVFSVAWNLLAVHVGYRKVHAVESTLCSMAEIAAMRALDFGKNRSATEEKNVRKAAGPKFNETRATARAAELEWLEGSSS